MKRRGRNIIEATEPEVLDLVVRGGRVVTPEGMLDAELGILHGKIVRLEPEVTDPTHAELDAAGRYVFPGIIDAHVHFNEPGRTEWEGLAHGSLALAAGGGTCFFDMPLNSEPPVLDAAALRAKREIAEQQSCVDFALWGGLVPGNLDKLAGLRDAGAIGLKAFMSNSGIDSFPRVDAKSLHEGMRRAAKLGLLVAVHAEDDTLAAKFTAEQKAKGKKDAQAWLASRPVEVELAAIRQAIEFAGETGCALHIVHVSSPEGVALITEARRHAGGRHGRDLLALPAAQRQGRRQAWRPRQVRPADPRRATPHGAVAGAARGEHPYGRFRSLSVAAGSEDVEEFLRDLGRHRRRAAWVPAADERMRRDGGQGSAAARRRAGAECRPPFPAR
jgi:hypothetical protein